MGLSKCTGSVINQPEHFPETEMPQLFYHFVNEFLEIKLTKNNTHHQDKSPGTEPFITAASLNLLQPCTPDPSIYLFLKMSSFSITLFSL